MATSLRQPQLAAACWSRTPAARIVARLPGARPQRRRPADSASSASLTAGLDDRRAILLTDLNWQIQNGLSYFGKEIAPELAYERMPAVILYAPGARCATTRPSTGTLS